MHLFAGSACSGRRTMLDRQIAAASDGRRAPGRRTPSAKTKPARRIIRARRRQTLKASSSGETTSRVTARWLAALASRNDRTRRSKTWRWLQAKRRGGIRAAGGPRRVPPAVLPKEGGQPLGGRGRGGRNRGIARRRGGWVPCRWHARGASAAKSRASRANQESPVIRASSLRSAMWKQ
jgi:hypothetical protein